MPNQPDLVIRNGTVIDGSGGAPFEADIAVSNGRITAVGKVATKGIAKGITKGIQEIDAKGCLVTPGFVDIHTHYDGQVTWDSRMAPSSSHGVTSAVIGNCGVGFAPCRADQRDLLIRLMEGVEDIPNPVLTDGVPWLWESYPQYLNFLAGRRYDMDVCGYLPHAALRVFVMGERGANREPATPADLAQMATLVREAMAAGAMGFSSSRTFLHRSSDGSSTPTFQVADEELTALALALKDCGKGVMQMIVDFDQPQAAFASMRALVERSGRPLSFTMIEGVLGIPEIPWANILDWCAAAIEQGLPIKGQVLGRAVGLMFGHELTLNPFYSAHSYRALSELPFDARIVQLRLPQLRARILAEPIDTNPANVLGTMVRDFNSMFLLGDPPNYEPSPEQSIAAQAARRGVSPQELAYDLMLERDGRNLLYYAITNYAHGSLDACLAMMRHPASVLGLGDGGAHCGTICDGSAPTFMLTHWGRNRSRGERLPLPWIVRALSYDTARTVGLMDRGLIAAGYKADLNVIDFDRLCLHPPQVTYDLPGGGRRLVQRADGYLATVVSGAVVYRDGKPTGELPGRLVRGPQQAPAAAA